MRTLTLDIVDYPGEWLLDLPLLGKSYEQWSAETLRAVAPRPPRRRCARPLARAPRRRSIRWRRPTRSVAIEAARLFTAYLQACRDEHQRHEPAAARPLPDARRSRRLAGADLRAARRCRPSGEPPSGSLWAMMQRRYEAYRDVVVRPFFREHFARLDRQIVLVDALAALNAGPEAVRDLQDALADDPRLLPDRPRRLARARCSGRAPTASCSPRPRPIICTTPRHDRLEAILRRMTDSARSRAPAIAGADGRRDRARRGARDPRGAWCAATAASCPSIIGTPCRANGVDGRHFDGTTEIALFPGDLPADPESILQRRACGLLAVDSASCASVRRSSRRPTTACRALPHIRLDRALQFLIGDRLR